MQRMGRTANAQLDFHKLPRRRLQHLCKKHGIPANKTNLFMADALTELFKNSGSSKDNSAPATPARSQIDESQSSQCTTEDNFQPGSGRKGEAAPAGDTDEAHSIDKNSICTTVAAASDAREESDDAHSIVKNEETNPAAPASGKDDVRTSLEDVKQVLVSELDVKLVDKNHIPESLLVLDEVHLLHVPEFLGPRSENSPNEMDIKGLLPEQKDNAIESTVRPSDELANAELHEAAETMVDAQDESHVNSDSTFPVEAEREEERPKQSTSIAQPSTVSLKDENEKKNQLVEKFQGQEDHPDFDARSIVHESPDAEPHEAAKAMVDGQAICKDENEKDFQTVEKPQAQEDYPDSDQTSDRTHEGRIAGCDAMVLETVSEASGIVSIQWKEMLERAIRKAKHRSSYKESPFLKRTMLNRSLVRARLKRAELLTRRRTKRNDEAGGRATDAAEGHAPQPVFGRKRFMEKAMAESAKRRKQMGLAHLESVSASRANETMSVSETCILELQESVVEDSSASNENQKTTGSICAGKVAKAQQKKHQEQFKTPLKGKSHLKAKVIAIKLAATQRDVILRSKRGMGAELPV